MRLRDNMGALFLTDEELGKKDDDHNLPRPPSLRSPPTWSPSRVSPRRSAKRLAVAFLAALLVYLFIKNIPTDVPIRDRRRPVYDHLQDLPTPLDPRPGPAGRRPPPKVTPDKLAQSAGDGSYDGPIKFFNLASSLYAIANTKGGFLTNKNILFAASNLKSASALLPVACRMGSELRNYVHFALMSRSEIDVDELLKMNGVDDSCEVIFHDARPDYSSTSTDARLGTSATHALHHINLYMHPQAILVDGSNSEDTFFLEAMRTKAHTIEKPLVELPHTPLAQLGWMTKLDSSSLAAWNKVDVDILIQAPPGGSGDLIRLLRSLSQADFASSTIPHLTIELPPSVDPPTAKFLESFRWPPAEDGSPPLARQLSMRRRIPRQSVSEEESAVRFLESFWPPNPQDSHVLVLSPQVELSPQFFHYLKYSILEYKYSNAAVLQEWGTRLFGISLDLPATYLNASEPLSPPTKKDVTLQPDAVLEDDGPTSFLWQSPNSNAILYFGQKWVELHGFVSRLIDYEHNKLAEQTASTTPPAAVLSEKLVSKRYPAWLEHALRLSRARGYWTLYPSGAAVSSLATVHGELYRAPEEYGAEVGNQDRSSAGEVALDQGPSLLDRLLPGGGTLPPFGKLPLLTWDGRLTDLAGLDVSAADYANKFREAIGGCEDMSPAELGPEKTAADLFCSSDA